MFIDVFKNNSRKYLRLAESKREKNAGGEKVARKTIIANIGPLEKYDDGEPEYLERLRRSFRTGEPLIEELGRYCEKGRVRERYKIAFEEGSPECAGSGKKYGHMLLERIAEELGLRNVVSSYKGFKKLEYDVWGFMKLLIYGRVLRPASKMATVRQNEEYYEAVIKEYNRDNVYDTLGFVWEHREQIIRRMNTNLVKKGKRQTGLIYYDVTNFYFEIGEADEDETDEAGEATEKGLRKYGVSKEERKQPVVQMGLFMDEAGVPIALESFSGNTLDHLTMLPALRASIDEIEFTRRFIMIGDRGICTYPNLVHLLDTGNGYIVAKSLLKSKQTDRNWTYKDEGYQYKPKAKEDIDENDDDGYNDKSFKYKSRVISREVNDESGKKRRINEKVVVYWSEKFEKRSKAENKSFLEFMEKLTESPSNFRATAMQAKSIKRFLRKEVVSEKTGEVFESSELRVMLDMGKVEEYRKSMGYYQIVTSELEMDALEIIDKYHGLSRIEEQFRIMKGDLGARPIFLSSPDHITAHLLVCLIALIIVRIIQNRIVDSGLVGSPAQKKVSWSAGLSADRIQNALNKWQLEMLPGDFYRFLNIDDPDLKLILDAFDISIPYKLFRRADLKSIKSNINVFM